MPALNKLIPAVLLLVFCSLLLCAQQGKFVLVPAGTYTIGKLNHQLNPLRKVKVDIFYIASTETTNRQFEIFVNATTYKTDAERSHNARVFQPGLKEFEWMTDTTAYWRFPNGTSRGGIENKLDHPVTCISYSDIMAYCKWAGVRLPTLEEWEVASRAGANTDYYFGNDKSKIAVYANTWLGRDHLKADSTDGFMYTSPVASFAPNAWGLYDMYGNVFEFCTGKLKKDQSASVVHARGGSWWCSKNACNFFNSYDIGRVHMRASFSNQGFRVVR